MSSKQKKERTGPGAVGCDGKVPPSRGPFQLMASRRLVPRDAGPKTDPKAADY